MITINNIQLINKILFYGPTGGTKGNIIGGGESGNRKTISILKKLGFTINILEKPYPLKVPLIRGILFPLQLLLTYIKGIVLLFNTKQHLHISGFYNHLIYIECLYVITAKLLKIHVVYELRAGGAIEGYREGSKLYQWFFRKTVSNASQVICQGADYIPFLKSITNSDPLYYPNYILNEDLKELNYNCRSKALTAKLVYVGRIAASKNIEFIINICSNINFENWECEIIGSGEPCYIDKINSLILKNNLQDKILLSGSKESKEISDILEHKHFFIFPSKEKREGHSNSLTEAMSQGVIPIASTAGFNASIIGEPKLIVEEFIAKDYAQIISDIWKSGRLNEISYEMYDRVQNLYTEKNVTQTLAIAHRSF